MGIGEKDFSGVEYSEKGIKGYGSCGGSGLGYSEKELDEQTNIFYIEPGKYNEELVPYLSKNNSIKQIHIKATNEILYDQDHETILGVFPSQNKVGKLEVCLMSGCPDDIREKVATLEGGKY